MKKLLLWLFCFITIKLAAQEVDFTTAKLAAQNYFAFKQKTEVENKISGFYQNNYNNHPSWYAFNFNPSGFVIIAGNMAAGPILGYSKYGNISLENPSPEWLFMMNEYDIYIDSLFMNDITINDINSRWNMLLNYSSGLKSHIFSGQDTMLISSRWGQGGPNIIDWNNFDDCDAYNFFVEETNTDCNDCGNDKCPSGCVATAMGQVLYYWQFAKGTDAFYDWWNMQDSLNHILSNNDYSIERDAIAYLLKRCGVNVGMDYCKDDECSSSANDANIKDVFLDLGFDDNMDFKRRIFFSHTAWKQMLRDELSNGRPVIYGGYRNDGFPPYPGHSFICDGYGWDIFADHLFHFNFGWTGGNDGFYSIDDNYPLFQTGLFGIKPDYISTQNLQNLEVLESNQIVYQVNNSINVAGSGTTFSVDGNGTTGGKCRMLAPNSIHLMTGFKAERGSSFRAKAFEPRLLTFTKSSLAGNSKTTTNQQEYESVIVYPNPVHDIMNIRMLNNSEIKEVNLFNTKGDLVLSNTLSAGYSSEINLSNLKPGLYILKVICQTGVFVEKVIKTE